jgi:hypothetical protein
MHDTDFGVLKDRLERELVLALAGFQTCSLMLEYLSQTWYGYTSALADS